MKQRILAYGDSNTWGWEAVETAFPAKRYNDEERWAGVMDNTLGEQYSVVVDGLAVRSTDIDDAMDWSSVKAEFFNSKKTLPAAIAREMPVDWIIIMLGTNDLRAQCERSAQDIANAIIGLTEQVALCEGGVAYPYAAPKCLVVAPPLLSEKLHPEFVDQFAGGREKSEKLGSALQKAAQAANVAFFDATSVIPEVAGIDGLHMSQAQHETLGVALANVIKQLSVK
ncbi:MAG: GDSL-type esterase/lipase family protein [Oceanospirillaceae bacterium]